MAGKVDAVIGAYRNFELNQMDIEGRPGRAFFPEREGVPIYDELIFVAHRDRARTQPMAAFVAAVTKGAAYLRSNPKESWTLFIKGRKTLDTELNRRAWRDTLPFFAAQPARLDSAKYQRFAEFLKRQKLIKKLRPVSEYAVEPAALSR